MTVVRQRNTGLDMAKAVLFLLVPITHILRPILMTNLTLMQVVMIPDSALMLVYFALSGYTFHPGRRSWAENVKRRFFQLMVPWILWTLADVVICTAYNMLSGTYSLQESLLGAWQAFLTNYGFPEAAITTAAAVDFYSGQIAFWFLPQMFAADLVFFALAGLVERSVPKTLLVSAVLLTLTGALNTYLPGDLPFTLEETFAYAAIMLLGCLAGRAHLLEEKPLKGWWFAFSLVFCLALLVLIRLTDASYENWGNQQIGSVFVQVLCASLLMYPAVFGCRELGRVCPPFERAFVWLGKHTLDLLLAHMPICVLLRKLPFLQDTESLAIDLVVLVLTFALCIVYSMVKDAICKKAGKG